DGRTGSAATEHRRAGHSCSGPHRCDRPRPPARPHRAERPGHPRCGAQGRGTAAGGARGTRSVAAGSL
ncbi:MAG: hypothetical protein AVDCRST_MAG50-1089, partial [uncultured Acidimicrobiales bacterium]